MKEKILRATAKVIVEAGIESASTRAICEAAGVTAPTLYHYFKSKAALIDAVAQFTFESHRETKKMKRSNDSLSNLRMYWDEYMHFCVSEPELHNTMIVSIAQGQSGGSAFGCFKDLHSEFKDLEARGMLEHPSLQCAQMFLGAAQGISLVVICIADRGNLPPLSTPTREAMLNGLIKKQFFSSKK